MPPSWCVSVPSSCRALCVGRVNDARCGRCASTCLVTTITAGTPGRHQRHACRHWDLYGFKCREISSAILKNVVGSAKCIWNLEQPMRPYLICCHRCSDWWLDTVRCSGIYRHNDSQDRTCYITGTLRLNPVQKQYGVHRTGHRPAQIWAYIYEHPQWIIWPDDDLAPNWRQAITWTNYGQDLCCHKTWRRWVVHNNTT